MTELDFDSITLDNVLPRVFAEAEGSGELHPSEIWRNKVTFLPGHYYLIEAESGTGKSSLCSYIYGNRHDYTGHIYYGSRDIRTLDIDDWCGLRRRHLALLPQEMRLFPELTAIENIEIKNRLTHHLSLDEIKLMFESLEIGSKMNTPVAKLSIGQQQRVALIRALAQPFKFLLLDEPVSHLDQRNNRMLAAMIVEHAQRQGAAIITTSVGNPLLIDVPYQSLAL